MKVNPVPAELREGDYIDEMEEGEILNQINLMQQ